MTTFGTQGHVLTNTSRATGQNTSDYECISVANGIYLYELQSGSNGGDNIAYESQTNQWTANPTTGGNYDPTIFLDAASNGANSITPTNADSTLHIGYTGAQNIWMISFSVDYSTGSGGSGAGTLSTNTLITLTQSGKSLVAFVGGGNATVSNLSIVDVNGLVPSNPGVSVWHTHTNGTDTTFSWPITEIGTYRLMNLNNPYAVITVTKLITKVFCNFW